MISDHMVDAFNRAYAAVYEQSSPITTQGDVVAVEREAVRAGIEAALDLAHTMQRSDVGLTGDEMKALHAAARRWVNAGHDRSSTSLARALDKLAERPAEGYRCQYVAFNGYRRCRQCLSVMASCTCPSAWPR